MARPQLTGSRIRTHRVDRGIRQAALARACGISASYLNLIEHNRRRIGGALLLKIAAALKVDPSVLSEGAEMQLVAAIDAAADGHPAVGVERARAEELAGRFPGWARLVAEQHREVRRLEQVIERLDDRLTHDPFLSASMHNVLSSVTAIRSASAILVQGEDIEPEWEARFHRNIYEDSQRLADATQALVHYLDNDTAGDASGSLPQDELDAWLLARGWRIAELEADPDADPDLIVAASEGLASPAARILAKRFLERYASDVAAIPADLLQDALAEGADALQLAHRFEATLPRVFRRLASLDAEMLPGGEVYGLVACDGSGTLTLRKPLPGFELPRYGAACPLWPLFEALQRPMAPIARTVVVAGRDEGVHQALAFSEISYPEGFGGPGIIEAWMLLRRDMASEAEGARRVGTSCRICAESACVGRREPSVFV